MWAFSASSSMPTSCRSCISSLTGGDGGLALAARHAEDHVAVDVLIGEGGEGLVVHDDDVRRGPGLQNAQRVGEVLLADLGVVLEEHIRDLAPADVGQAGFWLRWEQRATLRDSSISLV